MFDHYIQLLRLGKISKTRENPAGYTYLNPKTKSYGLECEIENVTQIHFKYLYLSLIVKFFQIGELKIEDKYLLDYMSDVQWFLENGDDLMKTDYELFLDKKIHSQRFYGEILKKYPETIRDIINISHKIYEDLTANQNVIQIDTDIIYHLGNLDMSWMPCQVDIQKYKLMYILRNSDRAILVDLNNQICIRGELSEKDEKIYMPIIKSRVRDFKITDITQ